MNSIQSSVWDTGISSEKKRTRLQEGSLFLFAMLLLVPTFFPFRAIPLPSPGIIFRAVLIGLMFTCFPFPSAGRSDRAHLFVLATTLFLIWMIAGLTYTSAPASGIDKILRFTLNGIITCLLLYLINPQDYDIKLFDGAVLTGSLITLLRFSPYIIEPGAVPLGRGGIFLSSGIVLAQTYGLGLCVCVSHLVASNKKKFLSVCIHGTLCGLFLIAIVSTGTRSALAGTGVVLALVFLWLLKKIRMQRLAVILLIAGVTAAIFIHASPALQQSSGLTRIINRTRGMTENTFMESPRMKIFRQSIGHFLESPLIGEGTGSAISFDLKNERDVNVLYPHNLILEVAAENGIIGILLILFVFIGPVGSILMFITSYSGPVEKEWLAVALMFSFLLTTSMVSGDIAANSRLWLLGLLLCAVCGPSYETTRGHQSNCEN